MPEAEPVEIARELFKDIPGRYQGFRLSDFSETVQLVARQFLAAEKGSSLYIFGAFGSGKSTLAVAILKQWRWPRRTELLARPWHPSHPEGIFLPAYEAARSLRNLETMQEAVLPWRTTPFLVLDDIGATRSTPHVREQLLFLLQERYDHLLSTVVTSNLTLEEFGRAVDPRAASRMQEGFILELTAGNHRRKKGKQGFLGKEEGHG